MNSVVLWVSHIVVRHKGSDRAALRFSAWIPDGDSPDRTQGAALIRALEIQKTLAKDPNQFDRIAREYSDDMVTRDFGGSLGGIRAGQLPPEFVDALAVMKPGDTSNVIKTALGYHILQRRAPPRDEEVSGKRIVIRYSRTCCGRAEEPSTRTREEASVLAETVAGAAKASPLEFEQLVKKFSESADTDEGGDLGVWSARDPGFMPREVEQLGKLAVGEVSKPFDSKFGFQILMRTAVEPRQRYAMANIAMPYDTTVSPDQPGSWTSVRAEMNRLAKTIRKDPSQFDRVRLEKCCADLEQWTQGRGEPGVTPVLQRLGIGEIAREPIQVGSFFYLVKRVEPATVPPATPPVYEVPNPRGPNFDSIVRYTPAGTLAKSARSLGAEAPHALNLSGSTTHALVGSLERLATAFEIAKEDDEARLQSWHHTLDEVRRLLGPTDFVRFDEYLNAWATRQAVAAPR